MELIASINSAINGFVWGRPHAGPSGGRRHFADHPQQRRPVPEVRLCHEEHHW